MRSKPLGKTTPHFTFDIEDSPSTVKHIRWGKDSTGMWHLLPHMRMVDDNSMVYYQCEEPHSSLYVTENVSTPPKGESTCVVCKGRYVSYIVEDS